MTSGLANIDAIKDERLYGLFPFFRPYVSADEIDAVGATLRTIRSDLWAEILEAIPAEWSVPQDVRTAIERFLLARAGFLVDNLHAIVHRELSPDAFDFGPEKEIQDD